MMDNLFFISIPLLIWLISNTVAGMKVKVSIFSKNRRQTREFTEDERQIILQLSEDVNLLIYQAVFVGVLFIIAILADFFALTTLIFIPFNPIWGFIISLFFMSVSYLLFYITNRRFDVITEARKRYIQDKKINTDSQLHRDAELLRSIRPPLKLINGIELVKTVKRLDPFAHSTPIECSTTEDLTHVKPFADVEDSAKFGKELREKAWERK
jgi:hypothetical protein